jgi:hypothetical protein
MYWDDWINKKIRTAESKREEAVGRWICPMPHSSRHLPSRKGRTQRSSVYHVGGGIQLDYWGYCENHCWAPCAGGAGALHAWQLGHSDERPPGFPAGRCSIVRPSPGRPHIVTAHRTPHPSGTRASRMQPTNCPASKAQGLFVRRNRWSWSRVMGHRVPVSQWVVFRCVLEYV